MPNAERPRGRNALTEVDPGTQAMGPEGQDHSGSCGGVTRYSGQSQLWQRGLRSKAGALKMHGIRDSKADRGQPVMGLHDV
ncbi:hypothetical protein OO012_08230 [Rhodobacteraceae bacterium KMM 6894]|nr:hypothetical protein [Rhodobacteraceae bacterium KMM 6894]